MPYQIIGRLGTCALKHSVRRNLFLVGSVPSRELASNPSPLVDILQRVQDGTLTPAEALKLIGVTPHMKNDQALESFANLDHERFNRTGFPEAVFAEGKIPAQVAAILDDMARRANESALHSNLKSNQLVRSAILATRYVVNCFGDPRCCCLLLSYR